MLKLRDAKPRGENHETQEVEKQAKAYSPTKQDQHIYTTHMYQEVWSERNWGVSTLKDKHVVVDVVVFIDHELERRGRDKCIS